MEHLTIAKEAMKHYHVQAEKIEFMGQSGNAIFRVTGGSAQDYTLRLSLSQNGALDSRWTSYDAIHSEMQWIDALASGTDLTVPAPITNSEGKYVTVVDGVSCTLLKWVEGENKPYVPTQKDAENIGIMIGKMHKFASGWEAGEGFSRPCYDSQAIKSVLEQLDQGTEFPFNEKTLRMVKEAGEKLILLVESLERRGDMWGMIHADLICPNFLFYKDEVRPIDFGACGYGYYMRDIALLFAFTPLHLRPAVFEAYSRSCPLPDNYVKLTEAFFVAAQLESLNFLLRVPEASEWVPNTFDKLTDREFLSFVKDEDFLFTGKPFWK
jgi:Ser/Thr protein kinase RdoA (MazF antagonist)